MIPLVEIIAAITDAKCSAGAAQRELHNGNATAAYELLDQAIRQMRNAKIDVGVHKLLATLDREVGAVTQ